MSIHLSLVCQQYSFDCTSIKTINNWKCIYWRFTCEKNVELTLSDIVLSYKRVEIKITSTCSPFWITNNAFITIQFKIFLWNLQCHYVSIFITFLYCFKFACNGNVTNLLPKSKENLIIYKYGSLLLLILILFDGIFM